MNGKMTRRNALRLVAGGISAAAVAAAGPKLRATALTDDVMDKDLERKLMESADELRRMIKRVNKQQGNPAAGDPTGTLNGPVTFPSQPVADKPFSIADTADIHLPRDKPGTYEVFLGLYLLTQSNQIIAKSGQVLSAEPGDYSLQGIFDVAGQPAGNYKKASLLTVTLPDMTQKRLDYKKVQFSIT